MTNCTKEVIMDFKHSPAACRSQKEVRCLVTAVVWSSSYSNISEKLPAASQPPLHLVNDHTAYRETCLMCNITMCVILLHALKLRRCCPRVEHLVLTTTGHMLCLPGCMSNSLWIVRLNSILSLQCVRLAERAGVTVGAVNTALCSSSCPSTVNGSSGFDVYHLSQSRLTSFVDQPIQLFSWHGSYDAATVDQQWQIGSWSDADLL